MEKKKTLNPSREEETVPRKKRRITVKKKNNLQAKTAVENCCSWILLPLDITVDILSRLPAKSVAKSRCVCKQWLSLTSDLCFLKLYHEKSSSYKIIINCVRDREINIADLSIGGGEKSNDKSYRHNLGSKWYQLSNFVDGLTCAYASTANSDIYLLNPTTKEFQKLPKKNYSHRTGFILESVGLGMDMTMEQYKVVRLTACSKSNRVRCEIYNVGTTQWRCLGEAPFSMWYSNNRVSLHGALYWIGFVATGNEEEEEEEIALFRFDIKYEKFGSAISIPYHSSSLKHLCRFNESGGELWLTFTHQISYYEIWTMKELNDTWVRKYKFNSSNFSSFQGYCYVIGIVDGEVILRAPGLGKRPLIHYNPRSGALQKLLTEQGMCRNVSIYRESLTSPKKLMNLPQPQRQPKKGGSEECILSI